MSSNEQPEFPYHLFKSFSFHDYLGVWVTCRAAVVQAPEGTLVVISQISSSPEHEILHDFRKLATEFYLEHLDTTAKWRVRWYAHYPANPDHDDYPDTFYQVGLDWYNWDVCNGYSNARWHWLSPEKSSWLLQNLIKESSTRTILDAARVRTKERTLTRWLAYFGALE